MSELAVSNDRLGDEDFFARRKEVLNTWPTGKEVDLDEAIEHHRQLMKRGQNVVTAMQEGRKNGHMLLQPRAGVATIEECLDILRHIQDYGSADVLPLTIDSCTRNLKYEEGELALQESIRTGRSMMNGFPMVNHGVKGTRFVIDSLKLPFEVRSAAVDARMTAEIALAAGCSAFHNGPIVPTMHFSRDYPLSQAIHDYQYIERLCAYYQEHGIPIVREIFGLLPCTIVPPGLVIATGVLDCLLAAGQGVKYIAASLINSGSLAQDIAALRVYPEMIREYLVKNGYGDVTVFSKCSQWNGAFPEDEARCYGLIIYLTFSAVWGGVDEMLVKSPEQGQNLPSKEANAAGLRAVRMAINMLKDQKPFSRPEVDTEAEEIRREVRTLVDAALELGKGDAVQASVKAFERGMLTVPFTINRRYANPEYQVMTVRDAEGAVRFHDFGNLPLDSAAKAYHREKVAERERLDNRKTDYDSVIQSLVSIAEGTLVR
ncbi:MAG: methylaspartate mutase subunit E [Chloroflexi bacterium]|nr:methylaspartate mutase subunit E [Chloroflexota bacterium]